MRVTLPRIFYICATMCWIILLWPNPVTIFLAACLSCLTLPIYRYLRMKSSTWNRSLAGRKGWLNRFLRWLASIFPLTAYILFLATALISPIAAVVLLVSPQAVAGLDRLRALKEQNFQIPPHWLEYLNSLRRHLDDYPAIEKFVNEFVTNLDSLINNFVSMLVTRSFGFLGSTMNIFWLIFLFFTLTILFTVHARLIRKLVGRILHLPITTINNFLLAIFKALKAVTMGIAFVALIQGALCGIGFAVAGVNQPAFWGMLATIVAPIPMIGTALVWLPLCISLWFSGQTMPALLLGLWGAVFVSGVDNVLRPFFLRQGIKASFFVLILSILCGISAFGAVGIIAGPILLAIGIQALEEGNRFYGSNCS